MKTRLRILLGIALATLTADQVTKYLAVAHLTSALEGRSGVWARLEGFLHLHNLDNDPQHPGGEDRAGGRAVEVVDGFWALRYVENPGAAVGVLARLPERVRAPLLHALSLLALGSILWMYRWLEERQRLLQVALSLVLGGALGNLVDRVVHGYVIDFVDWYWRSRPDLRWPTFNLADAAICVGVSFLVLDALRVRRERPQPLTGPAGAPPVLPGV